jgi:hypothetical protein
MAYAWPIRASLSQLQLLNKVIKSIILDKGFNCNDIVWGGGIVLRYNIVWGRGRRMEMKKMKN